MADQGKTGGWIKRLLGGGGPPTDMRIAADLAYLDKVEPGLTGKTVAYILSGEPATVVATLRAREQEIARAYSDLLRATGTFGPASEAITRTRATFILGGALDLMLAARYVQVLALTSHANATQYGRGTDKIGKAVKTLFLVLTHHYGGAVPKVGRLSGDDVLTLVEILGGRHADFVDCVMGSQWTQMADLFGTRDDLEEFALGLDPADVIEGVTRLPAAEQANAIKAMTWRKVARGPAYLDFLIDALGSGSSKVRDEARAALLTHDAATVTERVLPLASAGKVALRTAAAQMLGEIGTEAALDALRARRAEEKTQSVQMLLDQYIGAGPQAEPGMDGGYRAAGGETVTIPPRRALADEAAKPFGKGDLDRLRAIDAQMNAKQREWAAERKAAGHKVHPPRDVTYGSDIFAAFNGDKPILRGHGRDARDGVFLSYTPQNYHGWMREALTRLPMRRAMRIAVATLPDFAGMFSEWYSTPMTDWLGDMLRAGTIDFRDVLEAGAEARTPLRSRDYREKTMTPEAADFARIWMMQATTGGRWTAETLRATFGEEACWPAIAENLDTLAEALPPTNLSAQANEGAVAMLELLPALPAHLVQPLLFVAIGEGRGARERARTLLAKMPGLDETIAETLGDKRQAIRANAASFLAQRGADGALPALLKRLKTEKSETARAAMISAVADLGGDTTPYLSRKALLAEAETLAAKLPATKLDWLPLDQAPALRWADGAAVERVVLDAWTRLAVKLKEPGDGALFDLYLGQLDPADAEKLAGWLLTAWIGYDTLRPPMSEIVAEVTPTAQQYKSQYKWYKDTPLDEIVAMLVRHTMGTYPNSGSDSKGLLSMTHRAAPALLARQVGAYLKDHGKRVAQAKAMVDVLAGSGSSEAIQVLVATSTRFKQRSVREHAEACVIRLAEERGWTADELADRSIPSGGLEEGGAMELEVGEDLKTYTVRLAPDMSVRLANPAGKEVKALPAGKDAATKEAKGLLADLKKTLKTVTTQQRMRLYEAMMAGRVWRRDDWQADLNAHPIMSRLTERVVWRALDDAGNVIATFRPTPEGDMFDAAGDDADLGAATGIDLAHSATLGADARAAWLQHMEDFEIAPLFPQLTRPVLELTEAQRGETELADREGWLMEALRLRSATTKLGYDRGPVEDGAGFSEYSKTFRGAGIAATLHFTGSYVPEDNIPVAITRMTFNRGRRAMKLGDVPPLLLSECWNDLHDIAANGAFDPDWAKKGLY